MNLVPYEGVVDLRDLAFGGICEELPDVTPRYIKWLQVSAPLSDLLAFRLFVSTNVST